MKVGINFKIDEYTCPNTEFVDLYNKWQKATVFLSTRNFCGKEWDELIAYGKEHQEEVKEVLREFLTIEGNDRNWMAMSVLEACCPEVNEKMQVDGYLPSHDFHTLFNEIFGFNF